MAGARRFRAVLPPPGQNGLALRADKEYLPPMQERSHHVLLVRKVRNDKVAALVPEIVKWLEARGHRVSVVDSGADDPVYDRPDLDFALVLGGDGTMLGAARRVARTGLPLLGVNFGRIGYLTDLEPEQWRQGLTECLTGALPMRAYMTLRWRVRRDGEVVDEGHAVNDVVVSRAELARLVRLRISVDGHYMGDMRSDGAIVATPMGSSSYSVSAHGPLLHPGLDAVVFTPICPFRHALPPMALPSESRISIQILPGSTESRVTVDGQDGREILIGDTVEVTGRPESVYFLGRGRSFFDRLRSCGFIRPVSQASVVEGETAVPGVTDNHVEERA